MYPRGVSDEQLLWRLRSSGVRVSPAELVSDLALLVDRGDIRRRGDGRWEAVRAPNRDQSRKSTVRVQGEVQSGTILDAILYAAPGSVEASSFAASEVPAEDRAFGDSDKPLPPLPQLLKYFEATQRRDPRGKIEQFADTHGRAWQLLQFSGTWWRDASLNLPMSFLPPDFREALMIRGGGAAALGYLMSVFKTPTGNTLVPALIVPVSWKVQDDQLVVDVEPGPPSINPQWLTSISKSTQWNAANLQDRLIQEDEPDLDVICDRIRHAVATLGADAVKPSVLAGEMSTEAPGVRNCLGLFLTEDGTYTKGTADDLAALSQMPLTVLGATALGSALYGREVLQTAAVPVPLSDLTPSQLGAAEDALTSPLTVIQGPPGTGKSQVILNLISSAVLNGKTVLLAAKNHQALNEVEGRWADLVEHSVSVRGRDSTGEQSFSFYDVMKQLADAGVEPRSREAGQQSHLNLLAEAQSLAAGRRIDREIEEINLALSALIELPPTRQAEVLAKRSLLEALLDLWKNLLGSRKANSMPRTSASGQKRPSEEQLRSRLAELTNSASAGEDRGTDFADRARIILNAVAERVSAPDAIEWKYLSDRLRELAFDQKKKTSDLSPEDARAVLRHRPVWLISTLSVPSRVPLVPGLFDYVIIDEASQCDIASVLPLLARAKQAVVVGDPMQLGFIPSLGFKTEHALMDAAGLPRAGRFDFAQGSNSLFDFMHRRPAAKRHFLRDQFRSAPEIVGYLNDGFYNGKLVGRRENDSFKVPRDYKPGLAWEDVHGVAHRAKDGTINVAEAERIAEIIKTLANDASFEGSVGVIAPVNSQIGCIQLEIDKQLSEAQQQKLQLRVATADKFQGGEADVVLFSLTITRGGASSTLGFMQKEKRRINVAISRARAVCIVVGDLTFAQNCGIRHIEYLANRASGAFSRPRAPFDSLWERRMDEALKARGIYAIPQYPVGSKYLDFAIDPDGARINVEVDGRRWHTDENGDRKVSDRIRDMDMTARGWKVMRFWVHELSQDMGGCVEKVQRELETLKALNK